MKKNTDPILKGIAFCLAAHLMFAIMGACAKYLSDTHHVIEIVFHRNWIIFLAFFAFIIFSKKTHLLHSKQPKLTFARGVLGAISLICTYGALSMLPMAYATLIFFTSTILTPVLAFFFLREPVGIHRWSAVAIGMCGVLIIVQPSGAISMIGVALAFISACLHASMFTILRGLKNQDVLTTTFYFMLVGTIVSGLAMPWLWKPIAPELLWLFALTAISGTIGQLTLASAYRYAPAAVVTPFAYSALIWTILIDIFIWDYQLDFTSVFAGTVLIITAQGYIMYREYKRKEK